jgi:hypothetical protein
MVSPKGLTLFLLFQYETNILRIFNLLNQGFMMSFDYSDQRDVIKSRCTTT